MLSAIAHDMGTPLTRLAFRLEALPREQREAALSEIEIMRRLIADSLALDRSGSEPADRFDLADLASAMVQEYRRLDAPVRTGTIEHAPVVASSLALRRLIQNLIDNAVRYGKAATVSVSRTGQRAQLHIRDEGPGFDPGSRAKPGLDLAHGRGIDLARSAFDRVEFNACGNEVTLIRDLTRPPD